MKARAPCVSVGLNASLAMLCLAASLVGGRANVVSVATLTIYGKIQAQDVTSLEQSIANNRIESVHVSSNGGDAYAAMAIGRLIREHQIQVWADHNCFGSCALIFIAGVRRYNSGNIELYRPDLESEPSLASAKPPAMDLKLASDIRAYVAEMGVSEEFANLLMTANPKNVRLYDFKNDIRALVPRDEPTFNQALQVRFARGYGLAVDEYQRRESEAHSCKPLEQNMEYFKCAEPIMWGLSAETYEMRGKRVKVVCAAEQKEYADTMPYVRQPFNKSWWDEPALLRLENCRLGVMNGN